MIERLARFCVRYRYLVMGAWLVALIGLSVLGNAVKGDWLQQGGLPNTDTARAQALLNDEFPEFASQADQNASEIVLQVPAGTSGGLASKKDLIDAYLTKVATLKGVRNVVSPFDSAQPFVSPDGLTGVARIGFDASKAADITTLAQPVVDEATALRKEMTVEFSGFPFFKFVLPPSEAIGLTGAVIILLIAFGSIVAAGMPILTAIFGLGVTFALVNVFTSFLKMPQFTPQIAAMIGLGVGIDYALFIVTRYRDARHRGLDQEGAVVEAMSTAGRAVLFAGLTVAISLLGMLVIGLEFVNGMAIGATTAAAIMVLASMTLVPALLGSGVGRYIEGLFGRDRRETKRLADIAAEKETFWHRWSSYLQRHAWPAAIGGVVLLAVMAAPLFSLRTGVSDDGNLSKKLTIRKAYDLKAAAFGPGTNGPFFVTAKTPNDGDGAKIAELQKTISALTITSDGADKGKPAVAFVSPAQPSKSGKAVVFQVIPTTGPQEIATVDLVNRLRDTVVPEALAGTTAEAYVGGITAGNVDFANIMGSRLFIFIGVVLLLSFLLLMAVFRSILVPLKAVIMNVLSIGAAYGVIVAVFQWGWAKEFFGVGKGGPIEPWAPMFIFAIVFGLSMDYEVFLLSRVKEEYDRTKNNSYAVVEGLASTARVITAAAAIMVLVFLGFVLGDRSIKLMGLGLATAVFVDATIVRMILVPATMELLGDKNWWFPGWLDRIVPRINVEGASHGDTPVPAVNVGSVGD